MRFQNAKILVQVSGGPDSVFLLHALGLFTEKTSSSIRVLTISYEVWEDVGVQIVKEFCKQQRYVFRHLRCWIPNEDKDKVSLYRAARLRFVRMWCRQNAVDYIFLGHHADDVLETQLLKMFRGSGLGSLQSTYGNENLGKVIRPLLRISKCEILSYLKEKNIRFFLDPSNQDPYNKRNTLRVRLFPQMDAAWGSSWRKGLAQSFVALAADSQLLQVLLLQNLNPFLLRMEFGAFSFRPGFGEIAAPLQRAIVHKMLRYLNPSKDFSNKWVQEITACVLQNKKVRLWDRWDVERGFLSLCAENKVGGPEEILLSKEKVMVPYGEFVLGSLGEEDRRKMVVVDDRYPVCLRRMVEQDQFFSGTKAWKKLSKGKIPAVVKRNFCWSIRQQETTVAVVLLLPALWEQALLEKKIAVKTVWESCQRKEVQSSGKVVFIKKNLLLGCDSNMPLVKVGSENIFDLC